MSQSYVYDRIKQIASHLSILKKNLKQDLIAFQKDRTKQHLLDMMLLVKEAHFQRGYYSQLDLVIDVLEMQFEQTESCESKEQLEKIIERITSIFSEDKYKGELSSANECYAFKTLFYEHINDTHTYRDLVSNERSLNILSYDVPSRVLSIREINQDKNNSYGISINENYSPETTQSVAYGVGGNSNITNNAFDIVTVMPPTSAKYDPIGFRNDIIPKQEYMTLTSCNKFLRPNGLISLFMPYTRLDNDLCNYLARNFKDISITRIKDIIVEINGIKKTERTVDDEAYMTLRTIYHHFKYLPTRSEITYQLPDDIKEITSFRGSRITDQMLASIKTKSNAFSKMTNECIMIDSISKHTPLLPFNTGQIGLVLASGCADGIIHENDTACHLVKGRTERKVETTNKKKGEQEVITVYHTVKINALTPDGKLIEIS